MKENLKLFDFELEPADMDAIGALDRGEDGRTGPNPGSPRWKAFSRALISRLSSNIGVF
jgi:diketogulonate reductase-like aldo/keto reductase